MYNIFGNMSLVFFSSLKLKRSVWLVPRMLVWIRLHQNDSIIFNNRLLHAGLERGGCEYKFQGKNINALPKVTSENVVYSSLLCVSLSQMSQWALGCCAWLNTAGNPVRVCVSYLEHDKVPAWTPFFVTQHLGSLWCVTVLAPRNLWLIRPWDSSTTYHCLFNFRHAVGTRGKRFPVNGLFGDVCSFCTCLALWLAMQFWSR